MALVIRPLVSSSAARALAALGSLAALTALAALAAFACDDDRHAAASTDTDATTSDADATAPDDGTEGKPETTGGNGTDTHPADVSTSDVAGGKRTAVNAESSATWTYFAFATGALRNPDAGDSWDLGFQRYLIELGPGVAAAVLDGQDFAALTQAPADGYRTDAPGASQSEDFVLGPWYDYDPVKHTLSPTAGRVFVVRLAGGDYYKLALRDYYDEAGSSGFVTFDWAPLAAPAAPRRRAP